jgi:hypothetical protein
MTTPNIGDLYKSLRDELDMDENRRDRITPAGSVWRVTEVEPTFISIVCDATGGWINPDATDLALDFTPVPKTKQRTQHTPGPWEARHIIMGRYVYKKHRRRNCVFSNCRRLRYAGKHTVDGLCT